MSWATLYRPRWIHWLLLLLLTGMAGYVLISTAYFSDLQISQKRDQILGVLDDDHSYLQSFTPDKPYLSMLKIPFLTARDSIDKTGRINIRLLDEKQSEIASMDYEIPASASEFDIQLRFRPQSNSQNSTYFISIQAVADPDTIFILGSEYDALSHGELSINGTKTPFDLSFFAYTKPPPWFLIKETFSSSVPRFAGILTVGIILFTIGAALSTLLLKDIDRIEYFIYTLLLGITIPPIFLFILGLIGVPIGRILLLVIVAGSIFLTLLLVLMIKRKPHRPTSRAEWKEQLLLGALLLLALGTQVTQARDLIVPSGIGFETHQKIIEKIESRRAIPLEAIYHLGFHSNVVFLQLLTNQSAPEVTLEFGQWLGLVAGLSFYLLARKLFCDPLVALAATMLYWFISPIPSLFINIGRYPFLQGMAVLPGAVALAWDDSIKLSWRKAVIAVLMIGMLLTHSGSFIILSLIVLAIYLYGLLRHSNNRMLSISLMKPVIDMFVPALLVLIIKLYFIAHEGAWESFVNQHAPLITATDLQYVFYQTIQHGGFILWIVGIAGVVLFLAQQTRFLVGAVVLALILVLLNALQMTIFGHTASNLTNLLFLMVIPLALFACYFIIHLGIERNVYVLLIFILSLAGAYNISGVINPRNVFFLRADQKAMVWIEQNTPTASVFLVNSYLWDGTYKPTDGGFWIPSLTGRKVVFPDFQVDDTNIQNLFQTTTPDYIYLGSGYGPLTPSTVEAQNTTLVYQQDGIYIYRMPK